MSKWVLRSVQLLKVKIPIWTSDNPVMSDTITNHTMHTLKLEIGMLAMYVMWPGQKREFTFRISYQFLFTKA